MKISFGIPTLAAIFLSTMIGTGLGANYYFSHHPLKINKQISRERREIHGKVLRASPSGRLDINQYDSIIITLDSEGIRIPVYADAGSDAVTSSLLRLMNEQIGSNAQVYFNGYFRESGIFEADGAVIQERLMSFRARR